MSYISIYILYDIVILKVLFLSSMKHECKLFGQYIDELDAYLQSSYTKYYP